MKKAKIFLTALTVLAVVGGALAFKAKTQREFAKCNVNAVPKICELQTTTFKYDFTPSGGFITEYDLLGNPCVQDASGVWTCTARVKVGL